MFRDSSCGRVRDFLEVHRSIFVAVVEFKTVASDISRLAEDRTSMKLRAAEDIVDALNYFNQEPEVIKVCVPPQMISA